MTWHPRETPPDRWRVMTERLLRWVDPDRGDELRMHIEDAAAADEPLGPGDTASILGLAARTQIRRTLEQVPALIAGLPIVALCLVAYGSIYESHFAPWDLMEEIPSTDLTAASLRRAVELGWIAFLPAAALSGWRTVTSVAQRRFVLPAIYVTALIVLITQADIFIEHTAWFADGDLDAGDVDQVSSYSLGLISVAFLMPVIYLLADVLTRAWHGRRSTDHQPAAPPMTRDRFDPIAVGALLAPCLFALSPMMAFVLFVVLVWVTPSFRLLHKMVATAVLVPLVATALAVDRTDDLSPALLGALLAFVVVWAWLATVAFRAHRPATQATIGAPTAP